MFEPLFGADPEFFLTKNGLIVPSVGLVPGTKDAPQDIGKGVTIQEDNVAVEIGFTPVKYDTFTLAADEAFWHAQTYIGKLLGKEHKLDVHNRTYEFAHTDLLSKQAQEFGCLPDQLAYEHGDFRVPEKNDILHLPNPDDVKDARFVGGHVHVGYNRALSKVPEWALIQFLDLAYLYAIKDGVDMQGGRRKWYGLAGLYREKPYGVEYRTPSNFWLFNTRYVQYITEYARVVLNKPAFAQRMHKKIDWAKVQRSIANEQSEYTGDELYKIHNELVYAPAEMTDLYKEQTEAA